jgi:hypothetical protein
MDDLTDDERAAVRKALTDDPYPGGAAAKAAPVSAGEARAGSIQKKLTERFLIAVSREDHAPADGDRGHGAEPFPL